MTPQNQRPDHPLAADIATFRANVQGWVPQHADEFVVIAHGQLFNFFHAFEDALKAGLEQFGEELFLIKQVKEQPEVHHVNTPGLM